MDTESTGKKKRIIPVILGIVFVALIITVIVQALHITRLNRELKKSALSEISLRDNPSRLKTANSNFGETITYDGDISDKEKIKKLEDQIADMQEWQDYLEESIQKEENIETDRSELMRSTMRRMFSSQLESFVEEAGLSQEIKTKLYDILVEKNYESQNIYTGDIPYVERKKEMEYIAQKYDGLLSELLADKYSAYKEYMKVQSERNYINNFKDSMMMGDNWIEKQKEKKLITAIYDDRQAIRDLQKESMNDGNLSDIDRIKKNFEMEKMLYTRYIDSAKDILSESQLQKFQKFIDVEMATQEMRTNSMVSQSINHEEQVGDQ